MLVNKGSEEEKKGMYVVARIRTRVSIIAFPHKYTCMAYKYVFPYNYYTPSEYYMVNVAKVVELAHHHRNIHNTIRTIISYRHNHYQVEKA